MLVLSRERDQVILIGDDIEVTVVEIRGDKVRLGINAPISVDVHRKEVAEAIRREGRSGHTLDSLTAAAAATRCKPVGRNQA